MPAQAQEVFFEEDQSFRQVWVWALVSGVCVMLVVPFALVISGAPVKAGGSSLPGLLGLAVGGAVAIGAAVMMYVMKLTVRLDDTGLHVRFWPLLSRDIPLEDIASWDARTYRPLMEYGGWGIRRGWKGTAYNVSGNRGVQLELASGQRLLLGSQRAEELAAAIAQAKQHRS